MERFRGGAIGMDVDRGAIKAVQVSKAADGYILQHVGYHRLPEGAIVEGEVADSEMLASEIRGFWDLHSFRGKSVILGVAGRNVIVRFVDFPRLSPEDLASAMGFQAEEHIPMPLEDAVLDYIVLGPSTENPEDDRVLVVAAHRAMISGYTNAARPGGLKPTGIDVKALSLMRSTLPEVLFDNEETVLLLDVGTELSNLVVVQNRMPTLTQFIPLGFRDFSQAVADAADIEADEAERQAVNPMANIGSFLDEGGIEPASEAETLALDPSRPEDEEASDGDASAESGETETPSGDGKDADEAEPGFDEDTTREIGSSDDDGGRRGEPDGGGDERTETREESGESGGGVSETAPEAGDEVEASSGGEARPEDGRESSGDGDEAGNAIREEEGAGADDEARPEEREGSGGGEEAGNAAREEEGTASVDEARTEELSSDPALMYDVRRGLEDAAGRLAEEVQRSVEFHNSRPDAREISRVLISGEGALVRGLEGYLGELLGVAAERARPAAKLTANRSNVSDEQLGAMEPVLAIALGLAMDDES